MADGADTHVPVNEQPQRGGYARRSVELGSLRAAESALELALALPFGSLFSALLPTRSFRVRQLHLEYVNPERLGDNATYSAQVGETLDGGRAVELRLLVARGAWLCVRGLAVLELDAEGTPELDWRRTAEHQQGNSHG